MPIQGTNPSFGNAAKQVAEHASALARLELELAALELSRKAKALAVGIVLALAAVGLLGALALGSLKKGAPPVPNQAIEEAKLTGEAIKANGRNRPAP